MSRKLEMNFRLLLIQALLSLMKEVLLRKLRKLKMKKRLKKLIGTKPQRKSPRQTRRSY